MSANSIAGNPIIAQEVSSLKYTATVVLVGGSNNQVSILDGNPLTGSPTPQIVKGVKKNKVCSVNVSLILPVGSTAGATKSICTLTVNGQQYEPQQQGAVVGAWQNNQWTFCFVSLVDDPLVNIVLSSDQYFSCSVPNCFASAQFIQ